MVSRKYKGRRPYFIEHGLKLKRWWRLKMVEEQVQEQKGISLGAKSFDVLLLWVLLLYHYLRSTAAALHLL